MGERTIESGVWALDAGASGGWCQDLITEGGKLGRKLYPAFADVDLAAVSVADVLKVGLEGVCNLLSLGAGNSCSYKSNSRDRKCLGRFLDLS
jgi:hypothetical protein